MSATPYPHLRNMSWPAALAGTARKSPGIIPLAARSFVTIWLIDG